MVYQVEDYYKILKLSFRSLAFSGTSLPVSFAAWFFEKKSISLVIFCYLTKLHCLVAFISWEVVQYVQCKCLLTRLWRHTFWNCPYLSSRAGFFTWAKGQHKKFKDTIKAYFCYRHTLLKTTTLRRLFFMYFKSARVSSIVYQSLHF